MSISSECWYSQVLGYTKPVVKDVVGAVDHLVQWARVSGHSMQGGRCVKLISVFLVDIPECAAAVDKVYHKVQNLCTPCASSSASDARTWSAIGKDVGSVGSALFDCIGWMVFITSDICTSVEEFVPVPSSLAKVVGILEAGFLVVIGVEDGIKNVELQQSAQQWAQLLRSYFTIGVGMMLLGYFILGMPLNVGAILMMTTIMLIIKIGVDLNEYLFPQTVTAS